MAPARPVSLFETHRLRPLARRRLRRAAAKHHDESGVFVIAKFPVFMVPHSKHSYEQLDVQVVTRQQSGDIPLLVPEMTQEKMTWREFARAAGPQSYHIRPSVPRWIPVEPNQRYVLHTTRTGVGKKNRSNESKGTFDLTLQPGEKRVIFFDGMDRKRTPTVSLQRL